MQSKYPISSTDVILQKTPFTFDVSVWEVFWWFFTGARVCFLIPGGEKDPEAIVSAIERNQVTTMHFVPSMLNAFIDYIDGNIEIKRFSSLKQVFASGEALKLHQVEAFNSLFGSTNGTKLVNLYGPTEATVDVSYFDCSTDQELASVPIGKPIDNIELYVVNQHNKLMSVGVPGELCIAGVGLARGYLNRSELTAEKFVDNPFKPGERMYRTGDLARWLPDGNIEYLGRMDDQIKIRGFRIELGEINNVINSVDGVKEAVVLVKGNDENRYLCAYMVLDDVDLKSIKSSIQNKLPHYMMPTSYVSLDKMPITTNGKVDKQALLKMQSSDETRKKVPPRNFHDNIITQIWKEVLNLEEIFIDDDFFEMGGNSINVLQISSRLAEVLGVEISYADLMVYTTVFELSEYIKNLDNNKSKQFKHAHKINNSTSKKNIFIFHGADGSIFYFRYLAKLLEDDYNVYGLQPSGLNGEEPFPNSYYQMLHDYVKEIRAIQPEGPYIIAGFCIGNFLVNDVGNVFEQQGDEVAALIYLNSEAYIEKRHHKGIFLYRSILNTIDAWRKITRKDKMYTLEKFMNLMPKAKPVSRDEQLEILKQRSSIQYYYSQTLPLTSRYVHLGFAKSPTIVIKAEETNHPLFRKDLWENMVKGKLEYYVAPGEHETILFPPYVERVAEIIKSELPKYCEGE
ncbi:AMP-binding protein [Oceanobacillus picturae]|uniref:AMP-binding protein n=1 Tax=Oceanobacillus picturae TaxID=171693 RepID=UPI000E679F3C|nr:AMP-binding protein [Oceanobacillus picturae]RIU88535.1 hypothetical protein D1864_17745 [Oceanobacillus picturae]